MCVCLVTRNYCDSGVCMTVVFGSVLGSMGCYSLTTGRSMIAVCSNLAREIINFRGVFNEVWWSGVGSLLNVSGETCCNDTHVAIRFYRR